MFKARTSTTPQRHGHTVKRWMLPILAACLFPFAARAQSSDTGPVATASGALQFAHQGREYIVTLDNARFDHFPASRLTHFDDINMKNNVVQRMLIETDAGPVLYDFRGHAPLAQALGLRMTVRRAFWQGEEVILQGVKGWYRFEHGALTKLQSTKTTFH